MTWTPSAMRILYLEDEAIIAMETVEVLKDMGFTAINMAYSLPMAENTFAFVKRVMSCVTVKVP